ncbi:MAG: hypothetical protein ABWK01_06570 [Infirmifilum sp.]
MRVVLASHGNLGCEMINAVAMILGVSVREKATCVELVEGESLENYYDKLAKVAGNDTVILVDLFGGTPSRAALMLLQEGKARAVLTGFNMAMVIELLSNDTGDFQQLMSSVWKAGREGVRGFVGKELQEIAAEGKSEEKSLIRQLIKKVKS